MTKSEIQKTKAALLDLIMAEAFTARDHGHETRFREDCSLEEWLALDHPNQTALLARLYPSKWKPNG